MAYQGAEPCLELRQEVEPCLELRQEVEPCLELRQEAVLFQAVAAGELFQLVVVEVPCQLVAVEVPCQLVAVEAFYHLALEVAPMVEHDVPQVLEVWPQVVERGFVLALVALAQMAEHDVAEELGQELVALHRAVVYAGEIDPAPVVLHQGVAFSQEHRLGVVV